MIGLSGAIVMEREEFSRDLAGRGRSGLLPEADF